MCTACSAAEGPPHGHLTEASPSGYQPVEVNRIAGETEVIPDRPAFFIGKSLRHGAGFGPMLLVSDEKDRFETTGSITRFG
jgi:hypothetical protein